MNDPVCGVCGDTGYVWGDPKNGECGCVDHSVDDRYVKWTDDGPDGEFITLEVTCRGCGKREIAKDETVADCWWQIDQLCRWDTNEIRCEKCRDYCGEDGEEAGRGDYFN